MSLPLRSNMPFGALLGTPLLELLDHFGVEMVETRASDPGFLGAFVEYTATGRRRLLMPTGRSTLERDTAARMLLAAGLGLDVPPLPPGLEVTRV
ncbi:hypothetical protein [Streptomyces sp. MJP52]|uniref:hypothetical protein n=1 Tax=Streptomyces sp. MJP52 TaxID=2940555 RepID=UPI0024769D52|nr:hypothetical protein [Streptomyces sp. MJP52]MDH6224328.1 hypothetical protein [Streptomyces sp. MJP52]